MTALFLFNKNVLVEFENKGPPRKRTMRAASSLTFNYLSFEALKCVLIEGAGKDTEKNIDGRSVGPGFLNLGTVDSLGQIILFCWKLSCALLYVFQRPWPPLTTSYHDSEHLSPDIARCLLGAKPPVWEPLDQRHQSFLWGSCYSAVNLSFEDFVITLKSKDCWFSFRLLICKFVCLVKFLCNPQINILGALQSFLDTHMCREARHLSHLIYQFSAEVKQGGALPSRFSAQPVNKWPSPALFRATFVTSWCFLLVISLFKVARVYCWSAV